ncbi:MAG: Asp/Glu racemase [Pigmentiphaga sp.]
MNNRIYRIGQIVPSSNTTMETEVPAMFRAREAIAPERFTFHSSRMRMMKVTKAELAAMDAQADRCAAELSDAAMDVIGYACLVAIMSMGKGYHRVSEEKLTRIAAQGHPATQVVTSAGALLNGIQALGAKKVSIITPYMKPLTQLVVDYIEAEGIEVIDAISLEIDDNRAVGRQDPLNLVEVAGRLNTANADAIVLSACVQMPSLAAVPLVQAKQTLPVLSAAVATTYSMLQRLNLATSVPNAGALLDGAY